MNKLSDFLPQNDSALRQTAATEIIREPGVYTIEELHAMENIDESYDPAMDRMKKITDDLIKEELDEAERVLAAIASGEMEPIRDPFPVPTSFDKNGKAIYDHTKVISPTAIKPQIAADSDSADDDEFLPSY